MIPAILLINTVDLSHGGGENLPKSIVAATVQTDLTHQVKLKNLDSPNDDRYY